MVDYHTIEIIATVLFAVAIMHTFCAGLFAKLAHQNGPHSGLWHLFSEVEAVFGVWAAVLIIVMGLLVGLDPAVHYLEELDFTEPLFVVAIMIVAASKPILDLVSDIVQFLARKLPINTALTRFFLTMSLVPLFGSLITEPAAMTLAALMLRDYFFVGSNNTRFKYASVGVLFVNVSIGGVLTSFAAPPVLMVASKFGWDTLHMLLHFGWEALIIVLINAIALTLLFRNEISRCARSSSQSRAEGSEEATELQAEQISPFSVRLIHVLFLAGIVVFSHHPVIFIGLLLFFMGYSHAYERYQTPLMLKEAMMVGFFLAGLIALGGLQQWWLQDLLAGLEPNILYWGATGLTAITDNAALTYLGSLVEGTDEVWRHMLVAGAVSGGGLTVIANAPNPAGYSILRHHFPDESISPLKLLLAAIPPTLVVTVFFFFIVV